jgi:RHS repeat-associated protein
MVLAFLAALSLAAPAFAHVPARELAPAVDLLHASPIAEEPVQPLRIVPVDLFAEVAHVEAPIPSLSTALAQRFDAQNLEAERPQILHLTHAVRRNLTSGLRESLRVAIIKEINGLGPETRWATGTARERWYDPKTGSWLSPDPLGYQDSSNLYAFAGGDPVNKRDPRGEDSYDDKYKQYEQWYSAQLGTMWEKRKQLSEELKQRKGIDTGLLEAEDRILATQMMTFGGSPESAGMYFDAARAFGKKNALSMSPEQIHQELLSDEAVRFAPVIIGGVMAPHLAGVEERQGISLRGIWNRTSEFIGEAIDAYNESRWSSETGAIGTNVENISKSSRRAATQPVTKTLAEWLVDEPELLAQAREMFVNNPEWQGINPDSTPVTYRPRDQVAEIRALPGEAPGHHPHGLALNGPAGQRLTATGDTRTLRNPSHVQATNFQRQLIRVIKRKLGI